MSTRTCRACGSIFPETEEFFHRKSSGRFHVRCKPCTRADLPRVVAVPKGHNHPVTDLEQLFDEKRENRRLWFNAYNTARRVRLSPFYPADRENIERIYDQCRELASVSGTPHEVDHIVPLHGRLVSGLHCSWNLQVLTMADNRLKGNNF